MNTHRTRACIVGLALAAGCRHAPSPVVLTPERELIGGTVSDASYPPSWALLTPDAIAACGERWSRENPGWQVTCSREGFSQRWSTTDPALVSAIPAGAACDTKPEDLSRADALLRAHPSFFGLPAGAQVDLATHTPDIARCKGAMNGCVFVSETSPCVVEVEQFLENLSARVIMSKLRDADGTTRLSIEGHLWPRSLLPERRIARERVARLLVGLSYRVESTYTLLPPRDCNMVPGGRCEPARAWRDTTTWTLDEGDVSVDERNVQVERNHAIEFRRTACARGKLEPAKPPPDFARGERATSITPLHGAPADAIVCVDQITGERVDERGLPIGPPID